MKEEEKRRYEIADMVAGRHGWTGVYINRDEETNVVRVRQTDFTHSVFLTNKELYKIVKDIYKDLPVKVNPITWTVKEEEITLEWIKGKIEALGLSKVDVKKQTGIDSNSLYQILGGGRPLSRANKIMFFYYLHLVSYGVLIRQQIAEDHEKISKLIKENEELRDEVERLRKLK